MARIALPERAQTRGATMPITGETLTVAQAAERLNVHRETLYRLLATNALPLRAMKVGRIWRISKADVDAFLGTES
jgi:excisionase family DNA binding protein